MRYSQLRGFCLKTKSMDYRVSQKKIISAIKLLRNSLTIKIWIVKEFLDNLTAEVIFSTDSIIPGLGFQTKPSELRIPH